MSAPYPPSAQPPTSDPYAAAPHARGRGRGAGPGAKLASVGLQLVLSVGLLGWTAAFTGQAVLQLQLRRPPELPVLFWGCLLGVVVTALLMGLVNRLSSLGALLVGLVWTGLGLVLALNLGANGLVFQVAGELPGRSLSQGLIAFVGYGGLLVAGGLVLGGAVGIALTRRSRR